MATSTRFVFLMHPKEYKQEKAATGRLAHLDSLRGLSQLLAGGDVLSPLHVERALAALPGCTLINGSGPPENTTVTCCHGTSSSSATIIGSDVLMPCPISEFGAMIETAPLDEMLMKAFGVKSAAAADGSAALSSPRSARLI